MGWWSDRKKILGCVTSSFFHVFFVEWLFITLRNSWSSWAIWLTLSPFSTLFLLCFLLLQRFLCLFFIFPHLSLYLLLLGMKTEIGRTSLAISTPRACLNFSFLSHENVKVEYYRLCKRDTQLGCIQIRIVEEVYGRCCFFFVFEPDKTDLPTYSTMHLWIK